MAKKARVRKADAATRAKSSGKAKAKSSGKPKPKAKASAKTRDWDAFLNAFRGKHCRVAKRVWFCASYFRPYVFAEAEAEELTGVVINQVIGNWELCEEGFGRPRAELALFAINSPEDEPPGSMIDAALFYDRTTGETFIYEEADFNPTGGPGKRALRLDQLGLEVVKQ